MKHYALLLKKQFFDAFPFGSKKACSKNLAGTLLSAVLVMVIVVAFALIFAEFTKTYTQIKINRVPDVAARQYELMSIAYFVLIIVFVLSGINRLCYTLFENSDISVLISMPFSTFEIFASKVTWLYIRQTIISLIAVLTLNLTFFITTNLISAYNVIMSFVVAIFLPVIPLAISSVLVLPYYYIKRIVKSHYLLALAVLVVLLVGFCIIYSRAFGLAERLIGTGKLSSLFDERAMRKMGAFTMHCYPANLIAGLMLGRDTGRCVGILIAYIVGSLAVGIPIIHAIFVRVTQAGFSAHVPHIRHSKLHFIKSGRLGSLLLKELITVLRTPSYAYMYFATAIVMPLMAYYSAKLGSTLISSMLGNVAFDFELCTFVVLLYSTLTNTFCSTSISRDGYMSMVQKTLPYSPAQILSSKMLFSGIVSELSIIVACITLTASGLENPADGLATFVSATMLAAAQIAFATRLDLNHPHFSRTDDGEIKETNSTISIIILTGLVVCFAIGVLLLFNTVKGLIYGTPIGNDRGLSYVYALLIPFALLAGACAYFFVNLKKAYENLDSEG